MKITKYPQSCILIETKGKKILIDPGTLKYEESFAKEWQGSDIVLITHKHKDHCYEEVVLGLIERGITLYTSSEVVTEYPKLKSNILKAGQAVDLDGIRIEVVEAIHGFIPRLKEMNIEIEENIGFIINDGDKRFYHTSDCIGFSNEYKCDAIAVPVNNHGVCFDAYSAAEFSQDTGARLVIPVHYDNPALPADMEEVEREFKEHKLNYKVLGIGESVDV